MRNTHVNVKQENPGTISLIDLNKETMFIITARVRSTTGRLCFDTCLSFCLSIGGGGQSSRLSWGGGQFSQGGWGVGVGQLGGQLPGGSASGGGGQPAGGDQSARRVGQLGGGGQPG